MRGISDVLWQELKPFGINVTQVSAGAVRSNLAKKAINSGVVMPENSLYKPYEHHIVRRIWASQGSRAMPAEDFAKKVVEATIAPHPPRFMTLGGSSLIFYLLSWIPRSWALSLLWRQFYSPVGK